MKQDFEEFLMDKCDTHTNNDPVGFDKWLEELDGEEYMDYAQEYGNQCFTEGTQVVPENIITKEELKANQE